MRSFHQGKIRNLVARTRHTYKLWMYIWRRTRDVAGLV